MEFILLGWLGKGKALLEKGGQYWDSEKDKRDALLQEDIQLFADCRRVIQGQFPASNLSLSNFKDLKELREQVPHSFREKSFLYLYEENPEIYVLGDLHGYFVNLEGALALIDFFNRVKVNPEIKLIFLGDYVDRGGRSSEVIRTVCLLQQEYPKNVILLRGNHEDLYEITDSTGRGTSRFASRTSPADWLKEWQEILGADYFRAFIELQNSLADTVAIGTPSETVLLIHGGIIRPEEIEKIQDLSFLLEDKHLSAMRWSDPIEGREEIPRMAETRFFFGSLQFERFMEKIKADYLIRGHEAIEEGCRSIWGGRLWNVFSAGGADNSEGNAYDEVNPHILKISGQGNRLDFLPERIPYEYFSQKFKELLELEKI